MLTSSPNDTPRAINESRRKETKNDSDPFLEGVNLPLGRIVSRFPDEIGESITIPRTTIR